MIQIVYKPNDARYIFIKGPSEQMDLMEKHFNKMPSYMYMPSYKGIKKPEVYLNKTRTKTGNIIYYCHSGLWRAIYNWCESKNIPVSGIDDEFKYTGMPMTLDEFTSYVNSWELNLQPYSYQIKAAWLILKYNQSLSELATRAGKTLIAYMVFRYMLEHGAHNILMVVPSIHLVKQGVKDMSDYKEFFKSETVWANSELCESANLTIGTFQSLVLKADKTSKSYDPHFFDKFDVVCVDEAHHLICQSINTILSQNFIKQVKLKFGFTGTLPKENTIDSFACQALMGPKIQTIKPIELIDKGVLARPYITQIYIKYDWNEQLIQQYIKCGEYLCSSYATKDKKKILLPPEQREFTIQHEKTLPYALKQIKPLYEPHEYAMYLIDLCKVNGSNLLNLEQMLVHRSSIRVNIMINLLKDMDKNCIVFAHNDTYIEYLGKMFAKEFPNKHIYIIKGSTSLKKRQKIIDNMLIYNDVILVASYGCAGTGLTFKNVDYGIFAQSFKSDCINRQSLGRLMLKTDEKEDFRLYDLVDVFPSEQIYKQGKAKHKTYINEGYEVDMIEK